MVLMQRLRVSSLDGKARRVPITLSHRRAMVSGLSSVFEVEQAGSSTVVKNRSFGQTLLAITGGDGTPVWSGVDDYDKTGMKRVNLTVPLDVPAQGSREVIVRLPSPTLDDSNAATLATCGPSGTIHTGADFRLVSMFLTSARGRSSSAAVDSSVGGLGAPTGEIRVPN